MLAGMADRDIEKNVAKDPFVSTLRRLADAIENGEPFRIQVQNKRFEVPATDGARGRARGRGRQRRALARASVEARVVATDLPNLLGREARIVAEVWASESLEPKLARPSCGAATCSWGLNTNDVALTCQRVFRRDHSHVSIDALPAKAESQGSTVTGLQLAANLDDIASSLEQGSKVFSRPRRGTHSRNAADYLLLLVEMDFDRSPWKRNRDSHDRMRIRSSPASDNAQRNYCNVIYKAHMGSRRLSKQPLGPASSQPSLTGEDLFFRSRDFMPGCLVRNHLFS